MLIRAGSTELARYTPASDFAWRVGVPLSALTAAGGVITISTDAIFQPSTAGSGDSRQLGLRFFDVTIAR